MGRVGWWVLAVLTGLLALNHLAGAVFFAIDSTESLMFGAFAALEVLALVVLWIPYRRGEFWAWVATWISIAPVLLVIAFGADAVGVFYLVTGVVMALAQLATLPDFGQRTS